MLDSTACIAHDLIGRESQWHSTVLLLTRKGVANCYASAAFHVIILAGMTLQCAYAGGEAADTCYSALPYAGSLQAVPDQVALPDMARSATPRAGELAWSLSSNGMMLTCHSSIQENKASGALEGSTCMIRIIMPSNVYLNAANSNQQG